MIAAISHPYGLEYTAPAMAQNAERRGPKNIMPM